MKSLALPTQSTYIADENWVGRAIDLEVDDQLLLPHDAQVEGTALRIVETLSNGLLASANEPGIGRVFQAKKGWAAYARVSRRCYAGRSCFRFEEEVPE